MPRPHPGPGRGSRRRPRARLLTLLVAALVVAPSAPAVGHDALIGTDPADGGVLDAAPSEVVLTFSADQMDVGTAVEVLDATGADHAVGAPTVTGAEVSQAVSDLGPGAYEVRWRAVSGDGHPLEGTFAFTVAMPPDTGTQATATAAAGSGATEPVPEPADVAEPAPADAAPAEPGTTVPAAAEASSGPPVAALVGASVAALVLAALGVTLARRGRHESA